MADLFPGVRSVFVRLSGAQEAASRAAQLAQQAAASGTFGVGGILVDRSGCLIAECVNSVIVHGRLQDPTAHVERQLVDWYFEERRRGLAAPPQDLVIVTSLDPCAMCAGAILLSGLNCIAVAEDPMSGIHNDGKPTRMPEQLQARAEGRMGFFGVSGHRPRLGPDLGQFFAGDISPDTLTGASASFTRSLDQARQLVGDGEGRAELSGLNHGDLRSLQSVLPEETWIFRDWNFAKRRTRQSREALPESRDSSVIVDAGGRGILGADSYEDRSPARSSVLELIRAYPALRRRAAEHLHLQLPHQRFCTIVKRCPPDLPEKVLMELGAVGSFLEQPRPTSRRPALAFIEWNSQSSRIKSYAARLPPFYTEFIGITVGPAKGLLARFAPEN